MKKIIIFISALILLCSCGNENSDVLLSDITQYTETDVTETLTKSTKSEAETETEISIVFPKKETDIYKKTIKSETEPEIQENQVLYSDNQKEILFEFIDTEHLENYRNTMRNTVYKITDRVVHSHIVLTNKSKKDFTILPGDFGLNGRKNNERYSMTVYEDNYGETAYHERYYVVCPGETVEFDVDFIGDKECIDCAERIYYKGLDYITSINGEKIELPEDLPPFVKQFSSENRYSVRDAVKTTLDAEKERTDNITVPMPQEHEYTARTEQNYYFVSAKYSKDKNYIIMKMRVQQTTTDSQMFRTHDFFVENSEGVTERVLYWDIDGSLIYGSYEKEYFENIGLDLYESVPFEVPVGKDGYEEYMLVFSDKENENKGRYTFIYEYDDLEIPFFIYD